MVVGILAMPLVILLIVVGSKRVELEQRQMESMLRDDETDGAPPGDRVDLDRGVVFIARRDRT
jgi:hypothetical protein